jgi:hypothetical protein
VELATEEHAPFHLLSPLAQSRNHSTNLLPTHQNNFARSIPTHLEPVVGTRAFGVCEDLLHYFHNGLVNLAQHGLTDFCHSERVRNRLPVLIL